MDPRTQTSAFGRLFAGGGRALVAGPFGLARRDHPHGNVGPHVLGELDRHLVLIQPVDRLVKHNVLRVDQEPVLPDGGGDLRRAHRPVQVPLLVRPGDDRELLAFQELGPLLDGGPLPGELLEVGLFLGLDGLEVGLGRRQRQAVGNQVVPGVPRPDLHHVPDAPELANVAAQ